MSETGELRERRRFGYSPTLDGIRQAEADVDLLLSRLEAAERQAEAQRLLLGKAESLFWTLLASQDANYLRPQMKAVHAEILQAGREDAALDALPEESEDGYGST